MPVDIIIFLSIISFSIIAGVLGIWKRIPLSLFISGALITFLVVTTDSIQPAFSNAEIIERPIYSLSYPMNQQTSTSFISLDSSFSALAQTVANTNSLLQGQKISCITPHLGKTGSPTGTALIQIMDNNGHVIKQFGSLNVTSIPTSDRDYKFCLDNHDYYILGQGDRIAIFFNTGTAGNTLNVYEAGSVFDSTDSYRSRLTTATNLWSDFITNDLRMILTSEDLSIEKTPTTIIEPVTFEVWHRIIFALIGSVIMLMGALIWKQEEK